VYTALAMTVDGKEMIRNEKAISRFVFASLFASQKVEVSERS
jgi:hypothetical protein